MLRFFLLFTCIGLANCAAPASKSSVSRKAHATHLTQTATARAAPRAPAPQRQKVGLNSNDIEVVAVSGMELLAFPPEQAKTGRNIIDGQTSLAGSRCAVQVRAEVSGATATLLANGAQCPDGPKPLQAKGILAKPKLEVQKGDILVLRVQ